MTMQDIERLAKDLGRIYRRLRVVAGNYASARATVDEKYAPRIIDLAGRMAMHREALIEAVRENPGLFKKPKTQRLHGVKFGFRKQKGSLSWVNKEKVLDLIRKHFPDLAEQLIITDEKPSKDGLAKLPVTDVKKLGVTVKKDYDEPVVVCDDSEASKLIDQVIRELEGRENGGAA